jgi:hypothetical protein
MKIELSEDIDFTFVVDDLKTTEDYQLIAKHIRMIYNRLCHEYDYSGKNFKEDVQGIVKEHPEVYAIGVIIFPDEENDEGIKESWEL